MEEIIVSSIFCVSVIVTLIIGFILQKKANEKTMKPFLRLSSFTIVFLIFNFLSELFDGKKEFIVLLYIVNFFTFIGIDFIVMAFNDYLYAFLESNGNKDTRGKKLVYILSIIRIVVVFILTITGDLFAFDENGCYVEVGKTSSIPYIISGIALVSLILNTIANKKQLTKRQFVVALIYQLVPSILILIEMIWNIYSLLGLGITLSCIIAYSLMQDTNIENEKIKARILEEISNKDLLTNMKNRRSYYNFTNNITEEESIGVIFCDINGLKYTNDHYGHKAGDDLIIKFANILISTFGFDNSFRISGDEFVAILKTDETSFNKKINELEKLISSNKNIASLGHAYGKGCKYDNLIIEAENKMYEDKKKSLHSRLNEEK